MTEPTEVRLLFFADRDGKPMVRVRYGFDVGRVYDAYAGAQSVVGAAVAFETRAHNGKRGWQ